MAKPSITTLVADLAATLRDEVLPHLGAHAGRAHSGAAEGGDVTFEIDEHAEKRMEAFLAERAPEVSFYSEDRGLVSPAGRSGRVGADRRPDRRHAARRSRASSPRCVSVAAARLDGEPTMADVQVGCVLELKSGAGFVAERGAGLEPAARLSREPLAGADVLDLRIPRPPGAGAGGGARAS